MPEGPELRHSRDRLRNLILNKNILRMSPTASGRYGENHPHGFLMVEQRLPLLVTSIDTKGKFMWWTLHDKGKTWYMWCTYGMSGQWSPRNVKKNDKHISFVVEHENGQLCFYDPRHFGTIKFVDDEAEQKRKLTSLGPDVLEDPQMEPEIFAERMLMKPSRTIAEALMDQRSISGVGNYLKAEALYRASVSPHRVVTELSSEELLSLWSQVILSSRESYADHGASIRTYKTVDNFSGTAQFEFRVYNKKSCPKGHPVTNEETLDKRTSWWCRVCQH